MRSLVVLFMLVAFPGAEYISTAEACNRCGRSVCLYTKPVAAVAVAPVQAVTQTDVYVVQNNGVAAPLVAQGTSAVVSNGGYQQLAAPLVDVERMLSLQAQFTMALKDVTAQNAGNFSNNLLRVAELQAPAVQRLVNGQTAQMVLQAAGLDDQQSANQTASAVVITNRNGVIETLQIAPEQVQALTTRNTTTTSQYTQSITSTPAAPLAQMQGKYPLVAQFCGKCHGEDVAQPKAGLYLGDDPNVVQAMRAKWFELTDVVGNGSMPPASAPQPTKDQRIALLDELQAIIKAKPAATQ